MEFMPHSLDNKLESEPGRYYFEKVMDRIRKLSKCVENGELLTKVHKIYIKYDESIASEGYKILSENSFVEIYVRSYVGYVYGLETLSQMIHGGNSIQLGMV